MASENLVQWNHRALLSSMLENNCPQCSSGSNFVHGAEAESNELGKKAHEFEFSAAADNHVNTLGRQEEKVNEYQMTVAVQPTSVGVSCYSDFEDLEKTVALWVKWKGKWHAGIRCLEVDCPRSILKGRLFHDPKKDFIVFFPHTRDYCWADMLLVCPIDELPETISSGTHYQGLEKVKDLSVPHSFMMQKLAVDMLDIIGKLHNEALIESARKGATWKEFAMEAYNCKDYSDLGRMLLKLESMILQHYIDPGWLQCSIDSWTQRCTNAKSAEAVELAKEELVDSLLWNKIEALRDAPTQSKQDSEWRNWKQEAMKWFSLLHPITDGVEEDQPLCDESLSVGLQISKKRPKLEIRRAETHASHMESNALTKAQSEPIDSGDFDSHRVENTVTFVPETHVTSATMDGAPDCSGSLVDRWDEIVVETGNNEFVGTTETKEAATDGASGGLMVPENKSRQCQAFVEAKGRQCNRYANDGDNYCCVHLVVYSHGKTSKAEVSPPVDTPMCAGTTTHGMKCKHRSQFGSTFCKKHRHQNGQHLATAEMTPNMSQRKASAKRSHTEMISMIGTGSCGERMLDGEPQNSLQEHALPAIGRVISSKRNTLLKSEESITTCSSQDLLQCIESLNKHGAGICSQRAKFHTLYCEKHIPSFLKRARNGKSRIISREIFLEFLNNCRSREQKIHLHQACVLLHAFTKSVLSRRNPVSKEIQLQLILSEASNDMYTGEYIMKLVSREIEKLSRLWNFDVETHEPRFSGVEQSGPEQPLELGSDKKLNTVKCKICSENFIDDQGLGAHWMDIHKKEAQWHFRGYACAICAKSFTNKKYLETHVREAHETQFHDQCMMSQCMPCGNQFMNLEELWVHVLSVHSMDLRLSSGTQQNNLVEGLSSQKLEHGNDVTENKNESNGGSRRFICKLCGLTFDLLPDLGRHHQAAHKGHPLTGHNPPKRFTNPYKLKSGRLIRPKISKSLETASYRIRNRANMRLKKRFQTSSLASSVARLQPRVAQVVGLGRLSDPQCLNVAKNLFSDIQEAKQRPSNLDLLSVARSACCKVNLHNALEEQFGAMPDRIYLKAARLCSELNIPVQWHHERFTCPKGCKPTKVPQLLPPLMPLSTSLAVETSVLSDDLMNFDELDMDECHYVIESQHIKSKFTQTTIVLCEDVSFGMEPIPIRCVAEENTLDSLRTNVDERSNCIEYVAPMPWESFTYATKRLLDPSTDCATKGSQLGCACSHSTCSPGACDHVYLFENDYEAAKDIFGEPMHGKFAYDEKGRIILEEGYVVYECSSMCSCDTTCANRVLQNGLRVKLEVFKTVDKGWGLRAREAIARGTFVCEYIGEVSNDLLMNKRGKRYEDESCYLYSVDAHVDEMSGLDEVGQYVIDARYYGNVSRFINHSSTTFVNGQLLAEPGQLPSFGG
ncbi:hypothetical protein Sjap_016828 [Stephania japonica]|uniref:Histone-lysine N-methyltransferase SUVR5 n=1 Tax=Stephania japonica TaxID=461633 RepID=A0AAP0I540_9MAGN